MPKLDESKLQAEIAKDHLRCAMDNIDIAIQYIAEDKWDAACTHLTECEFNARLVTREADAVARECAARMERGIVARDVHGNLKPGKE